jgi:hypothetical protein
VRELGVFDGGPLAVIGYGLAGLVALGLLLPMRCHGPISKPPFRGCRTPVIGLLGRCRHHGRRPDVRLVCLLGGERLASRRVCDRCGRARVFGRLRDTGRPFLGCSQYPSCKNARLLAGYRV